MFSTDLIHTLCKTSLSYEPIFCYCAWCIAINSVLRMALTTVMSAKINFYIKIYTSKLERASKLSDKQKHRANSSNSYQRIPKQSKFSRFKQISFEMKAWNISISNCNFKTPPRGKSQWDRYKHNSSLQTFPMTKENCTKFSTKKVEIRSFQHDFKCPKFWRLTYND